jgi:hypothetical protein
MVQRGGFEEKEAAEAIESPEPEKKEEAARWLRWELKRLDILQQQNGGALVLTGEALSRVVISDLAITLLQYCNGKPGLNLVYLIAELLGVDCHRTSLTKQERKKWHLSNIVASLNILGEQWSDRKLAKIVGISPTTVAEWKRDPEFSDRVFVADQIIRVDGGLETIRAANAGLTLKEAINLAWDAGRSKIADESSEAAPAS